MHDTEHPDREEVGLVLDLVHLEDRQAAVEKVGLLRSVQQEPVGTILLVHVHGDAEGVRVNDLRRKLGLAHQVVVVAHQRPHDGRDVTVEVIKHGVRTLAPLTEDQANGIAETVKGAGLVELDAVDPGTLPATVGERLLQLAEQLLGDTPVPPVQELVHHILQGRRRGLVPALLRLVNRHDKGKQEVHTGTGLVSLAVDVVPMGTALERVEPERMVQVIGVIDTVPAAGLLADHGAQALIGITDVDDDHMLAGQVIVLDQRIHRKGLTGTGRSDDDGVHVVDHATRTRDRLNVKGDRDHPPAVAHVDDAVLHAEVVTVPKPVAEKGNDLTVEETVITEFRRGRRDAGIEVCRNDLVLFHHLHVELGPESRNYGIADLGNLLLLAPGEHVGEPLDGNGAVVRRLVKVVGKFPRVHGRLGGNAREGRIDTLAAVELTLDGTLRKDKDIPVDDMGDA